MNKMKITLVAHNEESPLANFLWDQLKMVDWLDCRRTLFGIWNDQMETEFFLPVMENLTFQEVLDVCELLRKEKKRSIHISCWDDHLIAGPTHFPGMTAGMDSCLLFLKQQELKRTPTSSELYEMTTCAVTADDLQRNLGVYHLAFADLVDELRLLYQDEPDQKLKFIDKAAFFCLSPGSSAPASSKYIYPLFEKENYPPPMGPPDCRVLLGKYQHSQTHIVNNLFLDRPASTIDEDEYKSVAIVGGGTAGYLTALSLKKRYPGLSVSLIESSKVPVIGVGEATTPEIRRFLFHTLGFSALDFYKKVRPTWKLGIKFFWGLPGDYYFNYPFGKSDIRSAYHINKDMNYCSLTSLLMSNDSSFVLSTMNSHSLEQFLSLSNDISYALHLDNVSFIGYLKEMALAAGVHYIDDLIVDSERKTDVNEILSIKGESGMSYEYDFYVDCSGFRSLLLEKMLESPYVSYNSSLFTDTAVTGCIPNRDKVKPYTYAESMNNGWCWCIPMRGEDHRGYVFSSNYCTIDEAADELQRKNPGIVGLKTVRFRSGRHQEACIGNVFAIGNSYAFVEPLESTGIHMIIKEVETLTHSFRQLKKSPSIRKAINYNMNAHWDYLRGFLSIHYKYNKKFQTEFWKDCREYTDISSIQWLVDLYKEVGLLSYTDEHFKRMIGQEIKDDIFGFLGLDTLLMGQGILPNRFPPSVQNKSIWMANIRTWQSIQQLTVPLENDLKILTRHPELI
ncbi:tryptophan 7-halogenase [Flavitalea sp. BT771]|uniref:tryptophan halogenase family protein n=1 Tax=Flavitalea sp. BT771 TaxID=3063329 RepID=UPI0026E2D980|nr:tryptophan halogenase family protein [Flavitalea sp. BT771]MDO6434599.1 tryptophan 7-halogenase [Flavitalea sp. BT771]MDV6223499.1 tryptophan halogenase family protein [Flavitalea sp. BT771]